MVIISPGPWRVLVFFGIFMDSVDFISAPKEPATSQICRLGKPLFEMCCFYMGIVQIALDPPPPLSNVANVEKKVP